MDKYESEEQGYTIRSLLEFIGITGVQMDTKLKIAGKENGIDIRIFLSEFESGVPDDSICSYMFLHGLDDVIIKQYGPQDQLWHFPDKRMMHTAESIKKQTIKDRIGGSK